MKTITKYISFLVLMALVLTSSCEKILNKEPTDKLSLEDLFKDTQGAKTALAGAYKSLLSSDTYQKNLMIYPDIMGGNIKYFKTSNTIFDDIYNLIQSRNDCTLNSTYQELYSQLNNVNNIIKYTPSASGPAAEKNRLVAEATCIRALLHFNLLKIFARPYQYTSDASHVGIVINLKPQLYGDPSPQRSSVAQSYLAIVTDLKSAINGLEGNPVFTTGYQVNYFNKTAAKALLSKVYLYSDDFADAFALADEVIKDPNYRLLNNNEYVASWVGRKPSAESIFELAIENDFSGNSIGNYYDLNDAMYGQFAATNDLLNLYSTTDVRGKNTMFNSKTINSTTFYATKKYAQGSLNATPVKVLRLSEIYLIRAECYAQANNFTLANADLNTIRKRADPAATDLGLSNKTDLLNAIYIERRKELDFEGNLLFDLLRTKQGINRTDCNAQTCTLPFTDYRLIMPLPAATVNANNVIIQNEGY
ncbi:RagB/SusD family nutrient uptake outer membrane protein [Pedobacter sp. SD-b]|uniref:RagB/SusD family nutrient uptake outer membrane protein n=1 Tax=Pedobacter segetis TaxID=2793069 RepID=A0ABS1BN02_9SPHI|nr:RagB/SusD family nutrient uptake outer membrane protein [Pedobacter segetis]MBK0384269.1 RagB/SusD family nutrient uptake outer membrane protein [Pedobacter segetis]